jgi:hypothetical protein
MKLEPILSQHRWMHERISSLCCWLAFLLPIIVNFENYFVIFVAQRDISASNFIERMFKSLPVLSKAVKVQKHESIFEDLKPLRWHFRYYFIDL